MSKVTPPDQISSNFWHGLGILESYLQEKGVELGPKDPIRVVRGSHTGLGDDMATIWVTIC